MKTLPNWVRPKLDQVLRTKSDPTLDGRIEQSAEQGAKVRDTIVEQFDRFEAMDNGARDLDSREGAVRFKLSGSGDHYYQIFTERSETESIQWGSMCNEEGTEFAAGIGITILRSEETFGLAFNQDGPSSGNYVGPGVAWFQEYKR